MCPDVSKEISNILKKLHELFSRYGRQKKETDMQVANGMAGREHLSERLGRAGSRAGDHIRADTIAFYLEGDFRCKR
jgi:hypothetical protein